MELEVTISSIGTPELVFIKNGEPSQLTKDEMQTIIDYLKDRQRIRLKYTELQQKVRTMLLLEEEYFKHLRKAKISTSLIPQALAPGIEYKLIKEKVIKLL